MASSFDEEQSKDSVVKPQSNIPSTSVQRPNACECSPYTPPPLPRIVSPGWLITYSKVTTLMSHAASSIPRHSSKTTATPTKTFHGRDALGAYLSSPDTFPSSIVLSHSENFVTLDDRFPKSSIHLLLLPRDQVKTHLHPFAAFSASDPEFLASVRRETAAVKLLVASELKRKFGAFSLLERRREEVLDRNEDKRLASKEEEVEEVPEGRDWTQDVMAGVHAGPSMNHLHIHILSRDFVSDRMRHRKHYNSFHTPFFVDLDDLPLAKNDPRRHPGRERYLAQELRCWRCGKGFGNRFQQLKLHLEEELEDWKKT